MPGVLVVPTPGHTDGHQSFVVRLADGSVVVAGQSHDTTTAYAGDVMTLRAHGDRHPPPLPTDTAPTVPTTPHHRTMEPAPTRAASAKPSYPDTTITPQRPSKSCSDPHQQPDERSGLAPK